jgi:PAS domain S-box-containing protein
MGADLPRALADVSVPAYVLDRNGVMVWMNPAAEALVGDIEGLPFIEFVEPQDRRRVQEQFLRKLLGKEKVTDYEFEAIPPSGKRTRIEVSSVPLVRGHRIIGVFGLAAEAPGPTAAPQPHHTLTPRQLQVLRRLALGASTIQIADDLHISRETVRNHVRGLLRGLEVHSRLEAIAAARAEGLLDD